jgi:hypothetical protein
MATEKELERTIKMLQEELTRSYDILQRYRDRCAEAHNALNDMTTEQFQRGADKPIREALAEIANL